MTRAEAELRALRLWAGDAAWAAYGWLVSRPPTFWVYAWAAVAAVGLGLAIGTWGP